MFLFNLNLSFYPYVVLPFVFKELKKIFKWGFCSWLDKEFNIKIKNKMISP